jgi:hypothetical protein
VNVTWRGDSRGFPEGEGTVVVVLMRRDSYIAVLAYSSIDFAIQDFELKDDFYVERLSPFVDVARERLDDLDQ